MMLGSGLRGTDPTIAASTGGDALTMLSPSSGATPGPAPRLSMAIAIAGTAFAILRPSRGLQDRPAGTFVTPR
jgi:hypothetical protein